MKKNNQIKMEQIDASDELDRIDRRILNILQKDNQITNLALAEKIGISAPPCFRRVKRLRDLGIIHKDTALIDPFKVGQRLIVFVYISLEKQRQDILEYVESKWLALKEIMQCYFVSGEVDYLLVVHVSDMNHYNEFARHVFANDPNIKNFRSSFCLNRVKYDTHIQFEEN